MNPYAVLGVDASATDAEIREAYLRLSKQVHPDRIADATPDERAAATRAMQDLTAAYEALRRRGSVDTPRQATAPVTATPGWRWPFVVLATVIVTTVLALATSGSTSPPPVSPTSDDLSGLEGRCITLTASGIFEDVVDCTRPHDARVVKVVDHAAPCPLWADSTLPSPKQDLCLDRV